ncbi:MAG: class I SAM-dependent methyltransferase [Candidatus Nanohaloarchaea archaeon]|nr:class I SAM-dependent methyltransferase [Candidatus Nanohaloarchaea archaeon]
MRDEVRKGYEDGDWPGEMGGDRELRPYEDEMLGKLLDRLEDSPDVLDIGCGTGLPFDRWLDEQGCSVTGVDIVEENLEHARDNVPDAEFINADFSRLDYEDDFDAVVSFYAVFHIPREEHADLFRRMHDWLRPGGHILLTISPEPLDEHRAEFLGGDMVWSAWSQDKTERLLRDAGFEIEDRYEEKRDDAGEHHIWVLARAA